MTGPDVPPPRPPLTGAEELAVATTTACLLMAFWIKCLQLRDEGTEPVIVMRAIEKTLGGLQAAMAMAEVESGRQWGT